MATKRAWFAAAGLLAAGGLSGAILTGTLSANAATTDSPSTSSSTSGSTSGSTDPADHDGPGRGGPGGDGGGHAGEATVTGTDASTLRAAALKAVPGGTVDRIESDSGDAAYEAHMTKSDGTQVTVKFDKDLKVTAVEDGMGT